MPFDVEATFGDDYLYFYEESTDDGHSDDDAAQILHLLDRPAGSSVLDAPCGTGRLSRRLAASGLAVTGVDISPRFIAAAEAEPVPTGSGGSLGYLVGDVRALPSDGPFDAVVCWYTSFGYYDDHDCQRVLSEFRRVLGPGGTLLIETMHHDGAVRHFTETPDAVVLTRGEDAQVDLSRFDPMTGRMETERTIYRDGQVRHSTHGIRLPTPPEWVAWLEQTGFEDVRCTAGDGSPLTLESWVMVVQATAADAPV